ncbi:MAG TPA: CoA-binding protein, partial [Proteobacteria bacterium]|nr:CoA-binding protein [Pseudomonadota bacterium]
MSIRNLKAMFEPVSVAVIGASNNPDSIGFALMRNLLAGGFIGPVMPVTPKYHAVAGVLAYSRVADLPEAPDLALLCTPPASIPGLVAELGAAGTRAVVIISAGLHRLSGSDGENLLTAVLTAAQPHMVRILGPNCAGLIIPRLGLNASFVNSGVTVGNIAFVSQSGAFSTVVLDWARTHRIGFSHFVSLGNSADVDFGDVLDYLASDPHTDVILLYMKEIRDARKFMSSARAAGRSKQVLAVKGGRFALSEPGSMPRSDTGALAVAGEVYDAALSRAGILRVDTIQDLFDAVETLARARPVIDRQLTIVSNGGGPGVMAVDALLAGGGVPADFPLALKRALEDCLPPFRQAANPLDILGDAPIERYLAVLKLLLGETGVKTVLLLHSPNALLDSSRLARALVEFLRGSRGSILTCWLGGDTIAEARQICAAANIPNYSTPETAVRAFLQLVAYRQNQETLKETPSSVPEDFSPDSQTAKMIVEKALAAGREWLTEPETKQVLNAYGIAGVETRIAADAETAAQMAVELGFPVALKILSPQVSNKFDVGGLALDLDTVAEVYKAAAAMRQRVGALRPEAVIEGFTVQKMARSHRAHETIVGVTTDPVFGPLILFGQGGIAVEVINDHAIALPPLNMALARELISRTRLARLLAGYRNRLPANLDALCLALVQVSQIVIDLPEVLEFDINPLYVDDQRVLALDARMRVARTGLPGDRRLAIQPYPKRLEEYLVLGGRRLLLRPIRPEDEPQHHAFIRRIDPEDFRLRFFGLIHDFYHQDLARFTQIDYNREMAFIATAETPDGGRETLGVVRGVSDLDNRKAEFAIIVLS